MLPSLALSRPVSPRLAPSRPVSPRLAHPSPPHPVQASPCCTTCSSNGSTTAPTTASCARRSASFSLIAPPRPISSRLLSPLPSPSPCRPRLAALPALRTARQPRQRPLPAPGGQLPLRSSPRLVPSPPVSAHPSPPHPVQASPCCTTCSSNGSTTVPTTASCVRRSASSTSRSRSLTKARRPS